MTVIAHISDLHFGTEDGRLAEALLGDLARLAPALVAVSGDLTQRARRSQFAAARAFLRRIEAPTLSVLGNHDLPLHDLARRALRPRARFHRHVEPDPTPFVAAPGVHAVGLDTTRPGRWKSGIVRAGAARAIGRLSAAPAGVLRVLVTHHPFVPQPGDDRSGMVRNHAHGIAAAAAAEVDLLLAGHLHLGFHARIQDVHPDAAHGMLVVQAGTAISRRHRGEANSFNVIRGDPARLEIEVRTWDGARFAPEEARAFRRGPAGWHAG